MTADEIRELIRAEIIELDGKIQGRDGQPGYAQAVAAMRLAKTALEHVLTESEQDV